MSKKRLALLVEPTSWGLSPAYGFFIRHAENVTMRNVKLTTRMPDVRSPFYLVDLKTVSMTGLSAVRHDAGVPFVVKRDVANDTIVEPENWKLRIL